MPTASDHVAPGRRAFDDAAATLAKLRAELGRVIIGQTRVRREVLDLPLRRRPLPAARRARPRQDAADQDARASAIDLKFSRIQFTPDLMPSDILGTDVIEEDVDDRQAPHPVHPRPDLREHHPRRRDQPHAAAHAGRAARGDAGIPGHRRRRPLSARAAAVRARDRESDRAGRHASAARSAARSLHVQRRDRLSRAGRRAPHPRRDDDRRRAAAIAPVATGADLERARTLVRDLPAAENVVDYALRLVRATRPGDADRAAGRARVGASGAPARAPVRRCCSAPRRARCSTAAACRRPTTCARSRCRCCVIACCSTSRRKPTASTPDQVIDRLLERRPVGVHVDRPRSTRPSSPRSTISSSSRAWSSRACAPGAHRSPFHGFSAEFSQHRAVSPRRRPEVSRLEAARAHRPALHAAVPRDDQHVGDARRSTPARRWTSRAERRSSKFRYASIVAAALAYLIVTQGDAVGLMTIGRRHARVPAGEERRLHLRTLLARLGQTDARRRVARRARDFARDGIAASAAACCSCSPISTTTESRVWRELRAVARRGHDVALLQVMSRARNRIPVPRRRRVRGSRVGGPRVVDAATIGRALSRRGRGVSGAGPAAGARRRARLHAAARPTCRRKQALRRHLLRRGSRPVSHATREKAMIAFANPWAWLGLVGARACRSSCTCCAGTAPTRRPFPTLRFLPDARVVAVRRHRPTDVPLMLIRLARGRRGRGGPRSTALAKCVGRARDRRPDSRAPSSWIDRREWRSRPTTAGRARSAPQRSSAGSAARRIRSSSTRSTFARDSRPRLGGLPVKPATARSSSSRASRPAA